MWGWVAAYGVFTVSAVLAGLAYMQGVNVFAWSQQRAMTRLGYCWVTPEGRYQQSPEHVAHVVRRSTTDKLWYAQSLDLLDGDQWVSEIGFDNPIAAHAYAEVQGWRAQ